MNYIFNVEYFNRIFETKNEDSLFVANAEELVNERNKEIFSFEFPEADTPLKECKSIEGYRDFSLYTLYPGLLVGTGNPHEIAVAGALKCGFTFDYVTGLPYITGSTLKGMIRSYFPGDTKNEEVSDGYNELIKGLLGKEEIDVLALKEDMFDGNDIFLGAFPVVEKNNRNILDMEFITPHKEKFKNPNPVSLVKVKPAVKFVFSYVFQDYVVDGVVMVSADEKAKLCKELLLFAGIGAKTNVGFGRFAERKPFMHDLVNRDGSANTGNNRPQQGGNNHHGNRNNRSNNRNDRSNNRNNEYIDNSATPNTMASLFAGIKLDN